LEDLKQLLSCYFSQDWPDEFVSDVSALAAYVRGEPKEYVVSAIAQLELLLAKSLTEEQLGNLLVHTLGCYFNPGYQGLTNRQWLERVRENLQKLAFGENMPR